MNRYLLILTLLLLTCGLPGLTMSVAPGGNTIELVSSSPAETVLKYHIATFETEQIQIAGQTWHHISLPDEGHLQLKGEPQLPVVNRSIIIDGKARMKLEVYDVEYTDLKLAVAPSKGVITRDIDPKSVPYEFGTSYLSDSFYPSDIATLSDPYILRDFRGITVQTTPFAYKADTQTLRVYTTYKVRVYSDGIDTVNTLNQSRESVSRSFSPLYQNHFVNWPGYRYTPVDDSYGKLLVVCHSSFMTAIQPWVNWKRQKGIETELVEWSTIGTTAAQLQTYIQNKYNQDNSLTFVQLVGDAPQIPSLSSGGGGSDPTFSLVAGSDNYPDIFIGRFSAQTLADLSPQINRSIAYERDATTTDTWLSQAMGIASNEGGGSQGDNGESDIAHMNNIRSDLLGYGYTSVDQIYDPGASAATVSANVNAGRGFINYVGHGSDTAWSTTGFSVTNATALTNGYKSPFIVDVACVNGNFVSMTCFAEGWMRSSNGGAITIYASTINQSWNSPMRAQDEITDLWVTETKSTAGGFYYSGSCKMMDIYGTDGVNMFKTWHIFGDASLMARSKTPLPMTVTHPNQIIIGASSMNISTGVTNALVSLTYNNQIYARGFTGSSGSISLPLNNMPAGSITYTLTVTAHNRVTYIGEVQQIPGTGPYVVVQNTQYSDSNNNSPEYGDSASYSVSFQNIGAAAANSLSASLSTTTPGISITDANEALGNLVAGATITRNNAFAFNIANNIADGTVAAFTITMTSGTNSWEHNFNLPISAPALAFGNVTISDPGGNNNGSLDPGETVTVTMPILNEGGAASPNGIATLTSPTTGITINTGSANFSAIAANGSGNASFSVSASGSLPQGSLANLSFLVTAGAYTVNQNISLEVGAPEEVTIGSGTSTQTYPLDRYYNYSGHEAIYLASEIATTGSISAIGYYKASGTDTNPIAPVNIYMKHTSATTLSTGNYSTAGYTLVYSGSFPNTAASGWMEVELDNRFEYDGSSNLSILIVKGNQEWTYDYPFWTYSTTGTTRTRQNHSDTTQPTSLTASTNLPNLKLRIYQSDPAPAAGIAVSPSSISEAVNSGNSISRQITISNTGSADLIWSIPERNTATRNIAGSTLSSDVSSYTPGSNATWILSVTNASPDSEWIRDIDIAFPATVTVNSVSSFTGGAYPLTASPQSGTGVTINWHYSDSDNFGGIYPNQTAIATVNLSIPASASGNLNLPWIISCDDYGSDPHSISGTLVFTLIGDPQPTDWYSINTYSGTIAPAGNAVITVRMDSEGLADGTYSSSFTINSNAQNNPSLSVPLSLTVETPINPYPVDPRFVAEWEPAQGAIVRYPFGQPYSLLQDLAENSLLYVLVTETLQSTAHANMQANGIDMENVRYINAPTDSYWIRDYGPWSIFDDELNLHLVDFAYNRPRPNDDATTPIVADYLDLGLYDLNMNHTGGNVMTDGMGKAMSTELVLSENSSLSQAEINQRFSNVLGVTDYQIYTDPTATYIDHIDCWAKLLDVDKVIIRRVPSSHAQYAAIENSVAQWQAKTSSYGTPYRIFRVDTPNNEPYTNSYIMNGNIYVPQMGTANDAAALAVYQTAMPGFTIRGYTHSNYQSTDALHCRINTIFDDQMIAVRHTPIDDLTSYQEYILTVEIDHHNSLNAETSFIAWSTSSSGPWQQSSLSHISGSTYSASFTSPAHLQSVYYWIQATDTTGRSTKLPLCGALDPFVANVTVANPNLPNWTPVSYPNPPATIHAQISFFGNPALEGDLVGAFVNGECRGTGVVSAQRNGYVTMQVQLAASGETVNFRIFSQADGQAYDTDLVINPALGETIGEDSPVTLVFTLDKPVVSINQDGSNLVLSWPEVTNADGYQILAAHSPDGEFSVISTITGTSYQINATELKGFFKVIALKGNRLQLRY